jgi:hypothetical protein
MPTYIILSNLSPDAFQDPKEFKKLADAVASRIRKMTFQALLTNADTLAGSVETPVAGILFATAALSPSRGQRSVASGAPRKSS